MKVIPLSDELRKFWKLYPIRIPGHSRCRECNCETILVQSMKGGFVTRNCPNHPDIHDTLPQSTFLKELNLWVSYPECKERMEAKVMDFDRGNYGYVCHTCGLAIKLSELLPLYKDL
jgi:hypothetical protein